eukprot:scaffold69541_cov18-Tisochrysis_lutea.AAC.3
MARSCRAQQITRWCSSVDLRTHAPSLQQIIMCDLLWMAFMQGTANRLALLISLRTHNATTVLACATLFDVGTADRLVLLISRRGPNAPPMLRTCANMLCLMSGVDHARKQMVSAAAVPALVDLMAAGACCVGAREECWLDRAREQMVSAAAVPAALKMDLLAAGACCLVARALLESGRSM